MPCAAEALAALFQDLGSSVRVPVLMYYAENDLYFGPAASRSWFQRLQAGGVEAEYVLQPPFGKNGRLCVGVEGMDAARQKTESRPTRGVSREMRFMGASCESGC